MPIHVTHFPTRRLFLKETLGTLTVLSAGSFAAEADFSNWVWMGDCHIDANPSAKARDVNMTDHFRAVTGQVLAERAGLDGVFLNGDCAYLQGMPGDYAQLRTLLEPFRRAGLDVHMALGNHDHRDNFRQAFGGGGDTSSPGPVSGKHLAVIQTPLVNWFLLDSLVEVNKVTGGFGESQLRWLETVLDQFADRPAILLAHHNPQLQPPPVKDGKQVVAGLADTEPFLELIQRKSQVKAYVFGHTHSWNIGQTEGGVHLINLPPVGYVFHPRQPSGWVKARIGRQGVELELRALNPAHPEHGKQRLLAWR